MKGACLSLILPSALEMSLSPLMPAGSVWPDQNEVVIHHRVPLQAFTLGEEFQFRRLRVNQHYVGVTAPPGVERLACALGDDLDAITILTPLALTS
jgi:hypothetical protein